jgi:hypothetical protein
MIEAPQCGVRTLEDGNHRRFSARKLHEINPPVRRNPSKRRPVVVVLKVDLRCVFQPNFVAGALPRG